MVAAALLIAVPLSSATSGTPGYSVHPGGTSLILPLGERAGYTAAVSATGGQRVQLSLQRSASVVRYSAKGRVTNQQIKASFGSLGHINVRLDLVPLPPDSARGSRCKGRNPLFKRGTYRGTVSFPAQAVDIPKVFVDHGRVYFEHRFRKVCKRHKPRQPGPGPIPQLKRRAEEGMLTVRGNGDGRTVRLEAALFALRRDPARSGGIVSAVAYERRGAVRVSRRASGFFGEASFLMSKRGTLPETIDVTPPGPFSGDALYSRGLGSSSSWTGALSVDLPGVKGVPLTGPGFQAVLCRGSVGTCIG